METTRRTFMAFLGGCMGAIATLGNAALPRRVFGGELHSFEKQSKAARIYLTLHLTDGNELSGKQRIWFGAAKDGKATNLNEVRFEAEYSGTVDRIALVDKHGEQVPLSMSQLNLSTKTVLMNDLVVFAPGAVAVT